MEKWEKFCHYYNPEDEEHYASYTGEWPFFWYAEQSFFKLTKESRQKEYIQMFDELAKSFKVLERFKEQPKETRGVLAMALAQYLQMTTFTDESEKLFAGYLDNATRKAEDKSRWLSVLKYYKGEQRCPYGDGDQRRLFWTLEQQWYTMIADEPDGDRYNEEFYADFPDGLWQISVKLPVSLKAFLYSRFYNNGGDKEMFPSLLNDYVNS